MNRDRIILLCIIVVVVLGGGYVLLVSPERKEASKVASQVSEAKSQLETADSALANAEQAQKQYAAAYASIVSLGKAVPTSQQVPSLMYQIAQAAGGKHVTFSSIVSTPSSGASSPTSTSSAATAAASGGFAAMPFTFVFEGGFSDLEHLFQQIDGFAKRTASGIQINGRLLTIQSIKLAPVQSATPGTASSKLTGTVTSTAYILPATQTVTGGATAAAPAGASPGASGGSSPTAPAIARVTP